MHLPSVLALFPHGQPPDDRRDWAKIISIDFGCDIRQSIDMPANHYENFASRLKISPFFSSDDPSRKALVFLWNLRSCSDHVLKPREEIKQVIPTHMEQLAWIILAKSTLHRDFLTRDMTRGTTSHSHGPYPLWTIPSIGSFLIIEDELKSPDILNKQIHALLKSQEDSRHKETGISSSSVSQTIRITSLPKP